MEFVDDELQEYLEHKSSAPRRVSVMIRPAGDRERAMEQLEEVGARDIEPLATESISLNISIDELEPLMQSSAFEAVELIRPVQVFDEGN
jgi:hypothetical protein